MGGLTSPSEGYYSEGTVVKITANPSSEYEFLDWGSYLEYSRATTFPPLTKCYNEFDVTVTANFIKKKYLLNLEVEGNGSVYKEVIKQGIIENYNSGTILRLNAVAESGWVFSEWVGDINGKEKTALTMDGPKNIKAVFKHYPNSGLPIIKLKTNQVVGPTMDKDSKVEGTVDNWRG